MLELGKIEKGVIMTLKKKETISTWIKWFIMNLRFTEQEIFDKMTNILFDRRANIGYCRTLNNLMLP